MATITSAGVGSGIDFESIIEATVAAEQTVTENTLNKRELNYNTELSGVGTFKAALDTFNEALQTLGDEDTFDTRIVNFDGVDEDEQAFEVEVDGSIPSGDFSVEVLQLATGSKLESAALGASDDTVGVGNLTFSAGGEEFSVEIDADDSLEDIRNKINQTGDNFGISANIINTDAGAVLTYSSSVTGAGNTLEVTADDDSLQSIATSTPSAGSGLTTLQDAVDAEVLINGQTVTNDTNTLEDKIEGVTLTLNSETTEAQDFTVEIDTGAALEAVESFVKAYNTLKGSLDTLSDASSGYLASDSTIRTVEQQLQRMFSGELQSDTEIQSLMELGITFTQDGEMEISSTGIGTLDSGSEVLNEALSTNYYAVQNFFGADDGLADQVDALISQYTGTDGSLVQREESLNESLEQVEEDYIDLYERMDELETSLRSQYAAIDSLIASYQTSSSYISSILSSI